ncbi:unnamed protein product, partial [Sphenostylis stenocarpa]
MADTTCYEENVNVYSQGLGCCHHDPCHEQALLHSNQLGNSAGYDAVLNWSSNNNANSGVLRSTEDDGVYVFDFVNLGYDNMENNDRVLWSIEEDVYIIDSVNLGHNQLQT